MDLFNLEEAEIVRISKSEYETNVEAYKLGNQHGLEYEVERTDLLEN